MDFRKSFIERDLKTIGENKDKLTSEEAAFYLSISGLLAQGKELTTHQFSYLQDIAKKVLSREATKEKKNLLKELKADEN